MERGGSTGTEKSCFTAAELRAAIDRCEREVERRVRAHEPPERVYGARQGIETLYRMLEEAERDEHRRDA